jgi:glycosyltransferase involved in cell wall biosynthesis
MAGYDVEVLGAWSDAKLKARDKELKSELPFAFTPAIDLTVSQSLRLRFRIRGRLGQIVHRWTGHQNHWELGPSAVPMLKAARRHHTAALFIAHSESALWAMSEVSAFGSERFRTAVDMEDWFSEDLLPEVRKHRPLKLLKRLEREALRQAAYSSCPSRAMSDALAQEYECCPPAVVYNAFSWADRQRLDGKMKDRRNRAVPSIHWYSQTLGPGPGLEELLEALPLVRSEAEIHLRGKMAVGFENAFRSRVPEPWRSRIFIHDLVSNDELLSRIAEHDIGLAGEQTYCRSRDLTVTNKILHYLLGGLAVVASDTAGQREIAAQSLGAVQLYRVGDPAALAEQLNKLLISPEQLRKSKADALRAAEQIFCWERQAPVLINCVAAALAGN